MRPLHAVAVLLLLILFTLPAAAERIWEPENGVQIAQKANAELFRAVTAELDDGSTVIVWTDGRTGQRELYGQRLSGDGAPLWGDDGRLLIDGPSMEEPLAMVAMEGDVILFWNDARNEYPWHAWDVYGQRFTDQGDPVWPGEGGDPASWGRYIDASWGEQYQVRLHADGQGGMYLLHIKDTPSDQTLVARRLLGDGSYDPAWPDNGLMIQHTTAYFTAPELIPAQPEGSGFFAGWFDQEACNLHRISHEGDILWPGPVNPFVGNDQDPGWPRFIADGEDGVIIAAAGVDIEEDENLYLQRVDSDGQRLWADQGETVSATDPRNWELVPAATGYAHLVWSELNQDGAIYAAGGGGAEFELHYATQTSMMQGWDFKTASDGNGGALIIDNSTLVHLTANGSELVAAGEIELDGTSRRDPGAILTAAGNVLWFTGDGQIEGTVYNVRVNLYDVSSHTAPLGETGRLLSPGGLGSIVHYDAATRQNQAWFAWTESVDDPLPDDPYHQRPAIFAQSREINSGEPAFDHPINVFPGLNSDNFFQSMTVQPTGDGILAATQVFPNDGVRLQKLSPSGDLLWGDSGIEVSAAEDVLTGSSFHLLGMPGGGAMVIQETYLNTPPFTSVIGGQRFDATGQPMWGDGHLQPLYEQHSLAGEVHLRSNGDIVFLAMSMDGMTSEFRALAVTPQGEVVQDVLLYAGNATLPTFKTALAGDTFVTTWGTPGDPWRAQAMTPDGELAWEEPVLASGGNNVNRFNIVAGPDSDSFWALWQHGDLNFQIRVQRFDFAGQPLLDPEDGVVIYSIQNENYSVQAALMMPNDDLLLAWEKPLSPDHPDLIYHRIAPDGSPAPGYENGPLDLSTAIWAQEKPRLLPDGHGGAVMAWTDERSSGHYYHRGVYAQRIHDNIAAADETHAARPDGWALSAAHPNPFNAATSVTVSLPARAALRVTLYDVLGRQVRTLVDEVRPAGPQTLTLDASELASGMYFLRAETDGHASLSRKLVLMK